MDITGALIDLIHYQIGRWMALRARRHTSCLRPPWGALPRDAGRCGCAQRHYGSRCQRHAELELVVLATREIAKPSTRRGTRSHAALWAFADRGYSRGLLLSRDSPRRPGRRQAAKQAKAIAQNTLKTPSRVFLSTPYAACSDSPGAVQMSQRFVKHWTDSIPCSRWARSEGPRLFLRRLASPARLLRIQSAARGYFEIWQTASWAIRRLPTISSVPP